MATKKLKVLILGYGAREHALAWKVAQSPRVGELFVAPGNAGTAEIGTNVPINDEDVNKLTLFALQNQIDLTIVGTNDPLALGVVDAFEAAGLAIFGPNRSAARLESSKAFAKGFMRRHGIATPAYITFTDYEEAVAYLDSLMPGKGVVVKVSGLGKMGMGATVCDNRAQAKMALRRYLVDELLGPQTVIIEERIQGPELSLFALSDGSTAVPLIPVRDHKRIYDNDKGPNTGGMGAFSPVPDVDGNLLTEIMETIIQPTIAGMAAEGNPYVGVLFAGLMMTDQGIQVLEFNSRFGNPEALIIMNLLESDLVEAMLACIEGRLTPDYVQISDQAAAAVVISSPGYPAEKFSVGLPISGLTGIREMSDVELFHHGTAVSGGQLVTARGRVLAVTAVGTDLRSALKKAYQATGKVQFQGAHYRRDIGLGLSETRGDAQTTYPEESLKGSYALGFLLCILCIKI